MIFSSRFFVMICVLLNSIPAWAFMNIESIRQSSKEGTYGSAGLKVNGQSGNSNKFSTEVTTLTLNRTDENEYLLAGKFRYGESRHIKDSHEGNLHLRYTRELTQRYSAESFAQTEFDEFKNLKRRDVLGLGLRTLIERADANALYLGTGAFYEHRLFKSVTPSDQTVRANFYISFVRTFSDHVSGTIIGYYQPSFEGFGDTRAQLDSALQVKLAERLALTVEFDLQYDSQPSPGVQKTDTTYMTGLAYAY